MGNIFLDKSNLVKTPVSALKLGMFVAELDRPWLETPFFVQGFIIRYQSEIKKLKEYCQFVYVEKQGREFQRKKNPFQPTLALGKRATSGFGESGIKKNSAQTSIVSSIPERESYQVKTSVHAEHYQAHKIHSVAKNTVKNIVQQARLGNAIETEGAKSLVNECVNSIIRNPYALMWMAKIKHVDDYTLEHSLNVSILAIAFGRHLRLETHEINRLGLCGLLHDVGKMQVSDEILNKPGKLTKDEEKIMRTHTILGRDLIMKNKGAESFVVDTTFNHHERVDGKGYPRGLNASEISTFSRIISIVDAFDAMTSNRCYDPSKTTLEALKEVYNCRGKQFDEELALEFIQLIGPYPPGTIVELKNGKVGIVLTSKEKKRHLPQLRVLLDENKQECEQVVVNLLDVEEGKLSPKYLISKVLREGSFGISIEEHTDEMLNEKNYLSPEDQAIKSELEDHLKD